MPGENPDGQIDLSNDGIFYERTISEFGTDRIFLSDSPCLTLHR
jgi:hypothetical protein